ncbi:cupin domain-containing protein [Nitrospinota bacterium]
MHFVGKIEDSLFTPPASYDGHAEGFRRADLLNREQGSVHLGFSIGVLQPGGRIDPCIHAFEKGVFITDGEIELNRDGKAYFLKQHDYALLPTGTAHAWRNRGEKSARWVEMCAPQPKLPGQWQDSFFTPQLEWAEEVILPDPKNPTCHLLGHFDESQLPPPADMSQDLCGFSKRMMMDKGFGSQHFHMFIIQFADGGQTTLHDHAFEEAYLMLQGEVGFVAEGKEYVLRPGDLAWTGVGSAYGFFANRGMAARMLEVQAPQPPAQNSVRRYAAWDDLRATLK